MPLCVSVLGPWLHAVTLFVFGVWLVSLGMMFSRSIPIVACLGGTPLLLETDKSLLCSC